MYSRNMLPAIMLAAAAVAGLTACDAQPAFRDSRPVNQWTVERLNDAAVENAVIAQRTLYGYHFVAGTAQLNDLGRRDVAILAAHLLEHPGSISVRRGSESADLHAARMDSVAATLADAGVPAGAIAMTDTTPEAGMAEARRVKLILERTDKPLAVEEAPKGQTRQ